MDKRFIVNEENEEFLTKITNGQFYAIGCGWYLDRPNKPTVNLYRGDMIFPECERLNEKTGKWITIYTAYGNREL